MVTTRSQRGKESKIDFKENNNNNLKDETIIGYRNNVSMTKFIYTLPYKRINLRKNPFFYRPGIGEQGVLMCEPYKSEILPLWKFKNPLIAKKSSQDLKEKFYDYIKNNDFIGADMTRKFIQMGFTRSRRYANHKGGKKYFNKKINKIQIPKLKIQDPIKAESATIFKKVLDEIKIDQEYLNLRKQFENSFALIPIPIFSDEKDPIK